MPAEDPDVKAARWRGYVVAVIALIIAEVTALNALYIGKPFGTFWDSREVKHGSDGTRTRDLRRDRPAF